MMRIQRRWQPAIYPNKTSNTITVRATAPIVDVVERLIRAHDKPRAEVVIEVQILEVNRSRAKQFGINLSDYALGLTFSPEVAPPNTSGAIPPTPPPPFNLNTISQGVSTADFYLTVPTAFVRFLETDSHTKQLAKPQLRGAEGQELTLNLGDQIPVVSTVFGAAAAGGFANIPQSSFTYRDVGVNIDDDAARDLRGRDHPRPHRREQQPRAERQRRRAGRPVVRLAPGARRGCGCARASPTCSPACSRTISGRSSPACPA